jgi:tripartite-type tricarboxylate transporter receptor subunit TctC
MLAGLGLPGQAQGKGWLPTQTVNYVIGVAPGGSVDLYARGIKQVLDSHKLANGQTIVADNKPGAAGLLALQQLQRNRGNGHCLGTFHTGSVAGQVTGMLLADIREFVPVAMLVEETTLVAVGPDSPLQSAQNLVAQLRRDPTSLKIAVAPV